MSLGEDLTITFMNKTQVSYWKALAAVILSLGSDMTYLKIELSNLKFQKGPRSVLRLA